MNDWQHDAASAEEQVYLDTVRAWLDRKIGMMNAQIIKRSDEDTRLKAQAWDERLELKSDANLADNAVMQQELTQRFWHTEELKKTVHEYERLKARPYFGRLDFAFGREARREDAELFYIGLKALFDTDECRDYVIDWRAPLSSLFYEQEPGPAAYPGPNGTIEGTIYGKKQILISDGKVRMVQESSKEICDENLYMVLSQPAGSHMKDIVSTIQKVQNDIIRHPEDDNLLVIGVAGSGKTSVALHRMAWLLYKKPDLAAESILLLCPNKYFGEYISRVLPILGEENAAQMTVAELEAGVVAALDARYLHYSYEEAEPERLAAAADPKLIRRVDEYVRGQADELFTAADIQLENVVIEEDEIAAYYHKRISKLTALEVLVDMKEHFLQKYEKSLEGGDERLIEEELRHMLKALRPDPLYRALLENPEFKQEFPVLANRASTGRLDRVDLAIMARMAQDLSGLRVREGMRCLVVDEAQDLLPIEHAVLADGFKGPINLFGDFSQAIRFELDKTYPDFIKKLYGIENGKNFYELREAYRSSFEIMDFASKLLKDDSISPLKRHGDPVRLLRTENESEHLRILITELNDMRGCGLRKNAVICASDEEVQRAEHMLSDYLKDPAFSQSGEEAESLSILTAQGAKGLEYDGVILFDVSEGKYSEQDLRTLYVSCTRALHRLVLISCGNPCTALSAAAEHFA